MIQVAVRLPPATEDGPQTDWAGAARYYEALADQYDTTGGEVTDYIFTRHGLTTFAELVLYCWIKHHEPRG